jgi:hypothetical protein
MRLPFGMIRSSATIGSMSAIALTSSFILSDMAFLAFVGMQATLTFDPSTSFLKRYSQVPDRAAVALDRGKESAVNLKIR